MVCDYSQCDCDCVLNSVELTNWCNCHLLNYGRYPLVKRPRKRGSRAQLWMVSLSFALLVERLNAKGVLLVYIAIIHNLVLVFLSRCTVWVGLFPWFGLDIKQIEILRCFLIACAILLSSSSQSNRVRVALGVVVRIVLPLFNGVSRSLQGIRAISFLEVLRNVRYSRQLLANLVAYTANRISLNLSTAEGKKTNTNHLLVWHSWIITNYMCSSRAQIRSSAKND